MTLTKYWVRQGYWVDDEFLEPGNPAHRECFYLASDVDRVVEALRETIQKREDSLVVVHGQRDKAQADLARVTEELEVYKKLIAQAPPVDFTGHGEGQAGAGLSFNEEQKNDSHDRIRRMDLI